MPHNLHCITFRQKSHLCRLILVYFLCILKLDDCRLINMPDSATLVLIVRCCLLDGQRRVFRNPWNMTSLIGHVMLVTWFPPPPPRIYTARLWCSSWATVFLKVPSVISLWTIALDKLLKCSRGVGHLRATSLESFDLESSCSDPSASELNCSPVVGLSLEKLNLSCEVHHVSLPETYLHLWRGYQLVINQGLITCLHHPSHSNTANYFELLRIMNYSILVEIAEMLYLPNGLVVTLCWPRSCVNELLYLTIYWSATSV